jgi:hypothetical protein
MEIIEKKGKKGGSFNTPKRGQKTTKQLFFQLTEEKTKKRPLLKFPHPSALKHEEIMKFHHFSPNFLDK